MIMREKFKYAGQKVKTKQGVGMSSFGQDMSGQDLLLRTGGKMLQDIPGMKQKVIHLFLSTVSVTFYMETIIMFQCLIMMWFMEKSDCLGISFM